MTMPIGDKQPFSKEQWNDFYFACLSHLHEEWELKDMQIILNERQMKLYDELLHEKDKLIKQMEQAEIDQEEDDVDKEAEKDEATEELVISQLHEDEQEETEEHLTKKHKTRSDSQKKPPGSAAQKKGPKLTEKDIKNMTVAMLCSELKIRELSMEGKKSELVTRLFDAIKE